MFNVKKIGNIKKKMENTVLKQRMVFLYSKLVMSLPMALILTSLYAVICLLGILSNTALIWVVLGGVFFPQSAWVQF